VLNLHRRLITPERVYLAALGFSGCAALVSVALPPAERGELAACIASATLGAAIGGLSIDTFLLSRPAGWVVSRGARWIPGVLAGCLVLSAVAAALLTALAGVGSPLVAVGTACALTVFNAAASLALRLKRFLFVYSMRAASGAVLVGGYALLYAGGRLDGGDWSTVWFGVQAGAATVLGAVVLSWAWRMRPMPAASATRAEYRSDLTALGKLHIGVCAQMVTYRIDQILLARFAGSGALGVYALAVAALEFAQAGAVVRSQRILAHRGEDAPPERTATVARAALPIAAAAVAGLAVLGLLRPEYDEAWLLGLCLIPGTLAVATGKTWSALLLKRAGEQATTAVALATMVVAVVLYAVLIPSAGAYGAALASTGAYVVYAYRTRAGLRRAPDLLANRAV
jgi:hypothetical protein